MTNPDPFKTYLQKLQKNLSTGAATEHTHRSALEALLEAVGDGVLATNEPRRIECGAPDYIITRAQTPIGYVEAKDVGTSLDTAERSEQTRRYRASLNNLILTDYLEFRWYVEGEHRETARLATVTRDGKVKRSKDGVQAVADLLQKFLVQEVPIHGRPGELARRMAALARMIRDLIEETFGRESEEGRLHAQLKAFRETLIPDLTPAQFADMYAQTIAYGLFAARMRLPSGQGFTRQQAAWNLPPTNPFLRKLFNEIAGPDLDPRIAWLVDDLAYLLARADMAEVLRDFGKRTRQEDPVVHFYETFLAAYDPEERVRRGVYYTPEPVVRYIVHSIDHLLRTRFGRPWGLADTATDPGEMVYILDPAAGTATFLYFAIQQIHETWMAMGQAGAWNNYVEEHLLPRVFGFELLMAPYAVAHMKLGILLQETGYDFTGDQRLGIYLTNTLEEAIARVETLGFAGFITKEANAAAEIKRDKPIMVVLGNPPYLGHSANKGRWIDDLLKGKLPDGAKTTSYYEVDSKSLRERNVKWLQDDYVKFIRFGQWRIERSGGGILAFVTNHGYLDNLTFRGMRQSLMETFTEIYILDLHGNVRKKEITPDGGPDENVFDIQQGVAIGIFVKEPGKPEPAELHHAHLWGSREVKYQQLLLEEDIRATKWASIKPQSPFYFFVPWDMSLEDEYRKGWTVKEIFPINVVGLFTARDSLTIHRSSEEVWQTIQDFITLPVEDARAKYKLGKDVRDWKVNLAQEDIRSSGPDRGKITPIAYRPFDVRLTYYTGNSKGFHCMPRGQVMRHMLSGDNIGLVANRQVIDDGIRHNWVSRHIMDLHIIQTAHASAYLFPLYLYPDAEKQDQLFDDATLSSWQPDGTHDGRVPNLDPRFVKAMEANLGLAFDPHKIGTAIGSADTFGPEDIFHYTYAVFHSPTYRERYAEFLKIDFPHLPLASDRALFKALAEKGQELMALHLMESPLLNQLITRFPATGSDEVVKVRYVELRQDEDGNEVPGRVYVNKTQYFEGIEPDVWGFQIGGYQVLHKWLKDRKGRKLSFDDLFHYQKIVVALKETMRLMEEIDGLIPAWPIE